MFSWNKIKKGFVGLAPMAGYSDSPYRRICKEMGADILYSELISATALHYNPKDEKTLKLCSFDESERPYILQFFGNNPEHFISAIKAIEKAGIRPDGIDINMGCPAPKVVKAGYGSVLIKEVEQAKEIVKSIKKEFPYPVSVKTRSGWDSVCAPDFAKELEKAGADAICIHARTYKQGFSGKADWEVIKQVKEAVKIPVIGNGDIKNQEDVLRMIEETGCDGVLIGRAALGNPWIFRLDNNQQIATIQTIEVLLKHIDYAEVFYDKDIALKEMRKHYGFYLKGLEGTKELRSKLVRSGSLEEVRDCLKALSLEI